MSFCEGTSVQVGLKRKGPPPVSGYPYFGTHPNTGDGHTPAPQLVYPRKCKNQIPRGSIGTMYLATGKRFLSIRRGSSTTNLRIKTTVLPEVPPAGVPKKHHFSQKKGPPPKWRRCPCCFYLEPPHNSILGHQFGKPKGPKSTLLCTNTTLCCSQVAWLRQRRSRQLHALRFVVLHGAGDADSERIEAESGVAFKCTLDGVKRQKKMGVWVFSSLARSYLCLPWLKQRRTP